MDRGVVRAYLLSPIAVMARVLSLSLSLSLSLCLFVFVSVSVPGQVNAAQIGILGKIGITSASVDILSDDGTSISKRNMTLGCDVPFLPPLYPARR